jgi:predicted nucleotidyltransferase component of viral defense system
MDRSNPYFKQAELLVRALPSIAQETRFALKGGTAINLFVRNLPRLSVDIDLVYLPIEDRKTSLAGIDDALNRIADSLEFSSPAYDVVRQVDGRSKRLLVQSSEAQIKIELSPVLRGSVFPPVVMSVSELVEELFGFAEIQVLTLPELYGGKICAALDRQHPRDLLQHPRDLFDVKLLLENEGIDRQIMNAFIVYLISHNRPIRELLSPQLKDLTDIYIKHFQGMSEIPVCAEELASARESMIETIHKEMTSKDKQFLLSFKSGAPDWSLIDLEGVDLLPAIQWKLVNIQKMDKEVHRKAVEQLAAILAEI